MSKLTPEEKAANKAAQKVRDRAYTLRRRLYRETCDAAQRAAEESIFAKKRDEAVEAMDCEWRNRNEVCDAITREILALQEKLARTKEQFSVSFEPKKKARDEAQKSFRDHRDALLGAVDSDFPDMNGCRSVAAWKVPADVLAEMEAAKAKA